MFLKRIFFISVFLFLRFYTNKFITLMFVQDLFLNRRVAIAKTIETSASHRNPRVQGSSGEKPRYTLKVPGSCKIRRGCNVLQVPIQIMPLKVPKRGSHPLSVGSKLRWYVFGSSFGMNPRPSGIAH